MAESPPEYESGQREHDRFEDLTRRLLKVPKAELEVERKAAEGRARNGAPTDRNDGKLGFGGKVD